MNHCSGGLGHSDICEAIVGHTPNRAIGRRAKTLAKNRGMGKLSPRLLAGGGGLRKILKGSQEETS